MSILALHDDHGRTVRYLRLSLTDRCNLRCLYCHSNARHQCIPHEKVLRYEEMLRLVRIVRGMGVGKVRLTGGEPFARKGCDDFLLRLRQRFDDLDIRITTNGTLLEEHIPLLQRIRISAVNLSLDSFDRETFARVTGRDMLPDVLRALEGSTAVVDCVGTGDACCENACTCSARPLFLKLQSRINDVLRDTTIADLASDYIEQKRRIEHAKGLS